MRSPAISTSASADDAGEHALQAGVHVAGHERSCDSFGAFDGSRHSCAATDSTIAEHGKRRCGLQIVGPARVARVRGSPFGHEVGDRGADPPIPGACSNPGPTAGTRSRDSRSAMFFSPPTSFWSAISSGVIVGNCSTLADDVEAGRGVVLVDDHGVDVVLRRAASR